MTEPLLRIEELSLSFPHGDGVRHILDHVSLEVNTGEILGVVGESGSGKTMTALSIMHLLPPGAQVQNGHIWFNGSDLTNMSEQWFSRIRVPR